MVYHKEIFFWCFMFVVFFLELIIAVVYTTNYIVKKEYPGELCGGDEHESMSIDKFNDCSEEDGKSYLFIEGSASNVTFKVYASSTDCSGSFTEYHYDLGECVQLPAELDDDEYAKLYITSDPVQYAKDNVIGGKFTQIMHGAGSSPKPNCASFSSAWTVIDGSCMPVSDTQSLLIYCPTDGSLLGRDTYTSNTCTGTMNLEERITEGNCTSLYYASYGIYLYVSYYYNCSLKQQYVAYSSYGCDDSTCSGNITHSDASMNAACDERVDDGTKTYLRLSFNDTNQVDIKNYGSKDCKNPTTASTSDINSCKLVNGEYHYFERVEDAESYMMTHIPYGKVSGAMVGYTIGSTRSTECVENVRFGGKSFEPGYCENDMMDGEGSWKIFKGCTQDGKIRVKQYSKAGCNDCDMIHDDYVESGGCFGLKNEEVYFYCKGWFNQSVCDYGEPIEDAPCTDGVTSICMMNLIFVLLGFFLLF